MAKLAPEAAWLGIDLGTSAVKAVLVKEDGTLLGEGQGELALRVPEPLAAEQSADDWWEAAVRATRACLAAAGGVRVAGVGLTGQKHALLLLDAQGRPLTAARLWADGRAIDGCKRFEEAVPRLAGRTGAPALPGYVVPKWLHLEAREKALVRATAHLLFAKDWLRYRLTGAFATDPTEAGASQLWRASSRRWDAQRCAAVGIDPRWLPPVVFSNALSGCVHQDAARRTGLEAGTPVVGGAGDNEAAALACGAVKPGRVAVILGTSGTVIATAPRRGRVGALVWGRFVTRRGVAATGTMLSAGRALAWAREAFLPSGASAAEALEVAFSVDPSTSVPLFIPALVGERSPVPDPHARAAFVGVETSHAAPHLLRAVADGVSATLGQIVDLLRASRVPVDELRLTSGAAASEPLVRQILAAAEAPGRVVGTREGPARGAALLAARQGASDQALCARAEAWAAAGPLQHPTRGAVQRMAGVKDGLARARRDLH